MKKELKKLKREELLDLLLEVTEENERLRKENKLLKEKCDEKTILLSNVGSIAEASLKLTNIFEEAQKAADIYLNSIKTVKNMNLQELNQEKIRNVTIQELNNGK